MNEKETLSSENDLTIFEQGISEMIHEQVLFTESIYAHLPISVEMYDTDGFLRFINDHALNMYGVSDRNAVVGTVNLFTNPYIDEQLKARIQSGEENITLDFEYDFNRINEDQYYATHNKDSMIFEVQIIPLWNKAGDIIGHLLLSNDKTAVKETEFRTEENKKNLEMAMEAANMSSWVYNVHKKTFNSLYGSSIVKEEASLDELLEILHPQDRDQLQLVFSQLINKEIENGQITLRIFDEAEKQYRHYESRMRLSSEHLGKLLIIGTQLDITERLQMVKKTQELISKRELAMQVSNIVHWDFDVRTRKFESYHDPINDYASDKFLTLTEYLNVIHPDDRSSVFDAMQSMLSGKDVTINFTCRIQTKYDDSWQYCNILGVPFEKDEYGNNIRFTGFRQNISKLHQLDEEIKERNYKMELTFKTIGMSYWDFDVTTRQFKAFNDPVNDYHPERTITPNDYMEVTHPEDLDCIRRNIEYMLQRADKEFSFQYRSKSKWDNEWQTLIVTGVPVEKDKKGNVIRYTGIKFNNTKWEKMAQELKELKEKAELSDRLKSAFLANMSHEIRTPLNAIVGFSGLMVHCDDPAEKEEYMNIIESNNELLLRLINDILDLSKIESGILERKREKFNLSRICNELYMMIQQKMTNPDVNLFVGNPYSDCWIFLDCNRLKQVWMNFLTNAVKCTHAGFIKMGYSIENGGIRFYVQDSGVGIPLELQDRVFGRFQKLNEFAQGTGLGLAISRAIIEGAGGEIGFTSNPGIGSTFWAWVPCKTETQENNENQENNEAQENKNTPAASALVQQMPSLSDVNKKDLKVLIAEDNDSNFSLVQHILFKYNLTRVKNGVEALEKTRNERYDIILMDMKMPIMGGLEAVRKIREFDTKVPIIALTAYAFDSDRASAMEAGCTAFLTKPLNKSQLLGLFSTKYQ